MALSFPKFILTLKKIKGMKIGIKQYQTIYYGKVDA